MSEKSITFLTNLDLMSQFRYNKQCSPLAVFPALDNISMEMVTSIDDVWTLYSQHGGDGRVVSTTVHNWTRWSGGEWEKGRREGINSLQIVAGTEETWLASINHY